MLLEREVELVALEGLVTGAATDGGKVVLLRGEAGIGKSALVTALARALAGESHALYGTCDDLFIPQPLAPFWDIARLEPALEAAVHAGDRLALMEQVLRLLSRTDRPTLIIIEDTHWADEATLDAIRYLGRRIDSSNGVLLLTYRDGEVDYDHPLRSVIGDIPAGSVVRFQLDGLSLDGVTAMLEGSDLSPGDVFSATRGNPLLVGMLAATREGGSPSSLQDALVARMAKLSIGAQEALKTLSVIPEPIRLDDAIRLASVDRDRVDECEQRGLLESEGGLIAFRHDLIRRAVEATLSDGERRAKHRAVLDALPEQTHPCLLIHSAVEIEDVDRLLELAPRSARYAAAAGGHIQAVEDFRTLGPYLDRLPAEDLGPYLDEWSMEEYLVGDYREAVRVGDLACKHYETLGDVRALSRALARAARYEENLGHRDAAERAARRAVEVLGPEAAGPDLAIAKEAGVYLQMMSGNVAAVPALVDEAIEVGGPDIDPVILIRCLNHKGTVMIGADHRHGHESLEEARRRAEAAGVWYEEARALSNMAWGAAEDREVQMAIDHARRAIRAAERHELPGSGVYARAMLARALEMAGDWDLANEIARDLLGTIAIAEMVALPILGIIEARRGRPGAAGLLERSWEMAAASTEFQRQGPAIDASAEHAWIVDAPPPVAELREQLDAGLEQRSSWTSGKLARWLWELGELDEPPAGIAEPYRLLIEGHATEAAAIWAERAMPYERALALMHGDTAERLEALELLETLGASAVAAKLRKNLRDEGVNVPRGKGASTRRHAAGLTARQAEVLELLAEGLSNTDIADRLFLSPRTVENHVSAILDKLDAASRDEAVERARADGLLGVGVG